MKHMQTLNLWQQWSGNTNESWNGDGVAMASHRDSLHYYGIKHLVAVSEQPSVEFTRLCDPSPH